jgi:hypothetical protein
MHYVTRRSHRMQKHKFGVTCPDVLFIKSIPVPPEHQKYCVDVSHTGMHYMTHRSLRIKIHMFSVTCPGGLFVESVLVRPEHER